ncbi:MAG: hypothetical protein QXQ13_07670 [Thermoplasmata archaeon]
MPKKKPMPRLKVRGRIASKVMEKDLLSRAKMLMDDAELILPECAADCGSCPFRRTRRRLEKIVKYKDDPVRLAKLARRGDKLARAYAATIGLVHEKKTPYLATAKYPGGTVTYAARGKTDKEKLIGVQNFDSPKWRVMSVLDLVRKKGLHFYSYGDSFVCTGKAAAPPDEYVRMAAEKVGATKLVGGAYLCPHGPEESDHIEFDWVTAGKRVLLCDQCAAKAKNTLAKLAEGMAVPKPLSEFEISVVRKLKAASGKKCDEDALNKPIDEKLLDDYAEGKLGDKELIEKHLATVKEELEAENRRLFVRGDKCFGEDYEAFAADMTEDEIERRALRALLRDHGHAVVIDSGASVNDLLSAHWAEGGRKVLEEFVPAGMAERYFKESEGTDSPLRIIRRAMKEAQCEEISASIPCYSGLSEHGLFVERIVRAYKTKGSSEAVAVIDSERSSDHRTRSIAHAFYLALGVTSKSWKFTEEEKQFGRGLTAAAKELLESRGPEEHHEKFCSFMRLAGSTEEIVRL